MTYRQADENCVCATAMILGVPQKTDTLKSILSWCPSKFFFLFFFFFLERALVLRNLFSFFYVNKKGCTRLYRRVEFIGYEASVSVEDKERGQRVKNIRL